MLPPKRCLTNLQWISVIVSYEQSCSTYQIVLQGTKWSKSPEDAVIGKGGRRGTRSGPGI